MSDKKTFKQRFWLVTVHALVLFAFFWYWLTFSISWEADSRIIQFCGWIKNIVFNDEQPDPEKYVFVDVSTDKMLIEQYDADGIPDGVWPIVNRKHLTTLLDALAAKNAHRYIILDIFLEDSTAEDSALQASMYKIKRCIQPYHFDGKTIPLHSRFKLEEGLADYDQDFGNFFKYKYLQHDTCRNVPLVMYENLYKEKMTKFAGLYFLDGTIVMNSFALDLRIRQYNLANRQFNAATEDSVLYNCIPLYTLGMLPPPLLGELAEKFKDKIIVIGDFYDRDIHQTSYGPTAGPLIQLNAFLALESGDIRLHWYGVVVLFGFIWMLCYWMPFLDNPESIPLFARYRRGRLSPFFQVIQYSLILGLFSIVYYMITGIYLNSMILGLYFGLREEGQEFLRIMFRRDR